MTERCGKRYGKRRHLTCRRLAGHTGTHSIRLTIHELRRTRASGSVRTARNPEPFGRGES